MPPRLAQRQTTPSQSWEAPPSLPFHKNTHAELLVACQLTAFLSLSHLNATNRPAHARKSRAVEQRTSRTAACAEPVIAAMLAAGKRGGAPCAAPLVVALAALLAASAGAAGADDFFSPLAPIFAPVINSICSTVACGKGNCTVAPGTMGYRCDCDPGWTQLHVGDDLRFLPCVIPNCSIDSSCSKDSSAPALAPLPAPPKNFSLDPCALAFCGTGGTCKKNDTGLGYHCECKDGYSNLLNITTMPCFQNCSIGADCAGIGILPYSNSSKPPAPPGSESISNNSNAAAPGSISRQVLLPALLLVVSLAVGQAI